MASTTSPDGIYLTEQTDDVDVAADLAAVATTTQTALTTLKAALPKFAKVNVTFVFSGSAESATVTVYYPAAITAPPLVIAAPAASNQTPFFVVRAPGYYADRVELRARNVSGSNLTASHTFPILLIQLP